MFQEVDLCNRDNYTLVDEQRDAYEPQQPTSAVPLPDWADGLEDADPCRCGAGYRDGECPACRVSSYKDTGASDYDTYRSSGAEQEDARHEMALEDAQDRAGRPLTAAEEREVIAAMRAGRRWKPAPQC